MEFTLKLKNEIDPVSVYAALVATSALCWQFFTWLRTGARLRLKVAPNMIMAGGHPLIRDGECFLFVEATNVGAQTTTVTHVLLMSYSNAFRLLVGRPSEQFFVKAEGGAGWHGVPHELEPGKRFVTFVLQAPEVVTLSKETYLFAEVVHSMSKRPARCRVRKIEVIDKQGKVKKPTKPAK